MQVIGIDLGGTKVVAAHFSENGEMTGTRSALLEGRTGTHVAALIADLCSALLEDLNLDMQEEKCIGICVPGIANSKTNRIWAPNIPGWENFSLKDFLAEAIPNTRVLVESDRTCYILGEVWKGVAQGCHNAIYLSVGTGIGAGILIDDRVLHGNADVVGAIGWMGLHSPFSEEYSLCGCFETYASGTGIAAHARKLSGQPGVYKNTKSVFEAYERGNTVALRVIDKAIECWGMASANLVSLFNPSMIVWGGGVFGPAAAFLERIYYEACKWAQPVSIRQCTFTQTGLSQLAGLYGAGKVAIDSFKQ